jgi:hypothetical protein
MDKFESALAATVRPDKEIVNLVRYTAMKPKPDITYRYVPEKRLDELYKKYRFDRAAGELLFSRLTRNGEVIFEDFLFETGANGTTPPPDMPKNRYAVVSVWAEVEETHNSSGIYCSDARKGLRSVLCVADLDADEIVWIGNPKPDMDIFVENNILFDLDKGFVRFLPDWNDVLSLDTMIRIGGRTTGNWIYFFPGPCGCACENAYKVNTETGEVQIC